MKIFTVVKNYSGLTCRRTDEEDWAMMKGKLKPENIIYVARDLKDEHLGELGLKEIVWDTVPNPVNNSVTKIKVPFSQDEEEIQASYEAQLQKVLDNLRHEVELKNEADRRFDMKMERHGKEIAEKKAALSAYFNDGMTEREILEKWKELGMPMPAPDCIQNIRIFYEMYWDDFRQAVKEYDFNAINDGYTQDRPELEAYRRWYSEGFPMLPPERISRLYSIRDMSWKQFRHFVKDTIQG